MKKNLTSFAENIYKFREKLNKSQSQFADYISKELKKKELILNTQIKASANGNQQILFHQWKY